MGKYTPIYRVVKNKEYNDFNEELEYTILTYDFDSKRNKIRVKGFNDWHEKPDDYFCYRTFAEQALVTKCCKRLKLQLEEAQTRIKELEDKDWYEANIKQFEAQNDRLIQERDSLKQQLEEKDKEIEIISSSKKHFKTCAENMSDILKTINSVLPKPQKNELNYKKVADDVVTLIKGKDKEIKRLKNLFELNNEVVINQGKEMFDLRVQVLQQKQNQTQLAIQELEKVKMMTEWKFNSIVDVVEYIDNQIKELKGE